ncbi:MAG: hypothetical protein RL497_1056, partial [Pseudomonadota bacterium]
VVKFYDEESNGGVNGGMVMVNNQSLTVDSNDSTLWKGKVTVPAGGMTAEVVAETADKKISLRESAKLLNKKDALKPLVMGINPGTYILIYDPFAHQIAKVNLANNLWSEYVKNDQLKGTEILFDFNSSNQHAYTIINNNQLVGAAVGSSVPAVYYAGAVPKPIGITFDGTNKRVLTLSNEGGKYIATAVATDTREAKDNTAFVNAKAAEKAGEETGTKAWEAPEGTVQGDFKQFNFHRVSKTYVIADERQVSGVKRTVIQGFTEGTGQKKFEAEVGPDISNIAINNNDGIVYVAENRSSMMASKLKAININTGAVTDLGESKNGITIAHYSDIRMDNNKKKLYIGDTVSDSIYEVDLASKVLSEVQVKAAAVDTGPTEEN